MSLRAIELFHIDAPLKKTIRHASHERSASDNLVVRVELEGGAVGFGEGVPRSYVTGETIESTFATLSSFDWARHVGRPATFAQVVERLLALELPETQNDPRGMAGNAARCAIELALLDAYGHHFGASVSQAVRQVANGHDILAPLPSRVRYSGAITSESLWREWLSTWSMCLFGFAQVKVKVGVAGQHDRLRLWHIRFVLGRKVDLRLDANEAWSLDELQERVRPLLPFRPSALEQPVPHNQVEGLAELRGRLGVPVMLDESLCGYPDALRATQQGTADLFNVRLSKCGGIIPSLKIISLAHRSGLGVQLGCHPGETGILSAAGRHVASNLRGLKYVEGSYDHFILRTRLTREDLTFGFGGWAKPLDGPGLGVHVDRAALERLTLQRKEVRYD
jgi:L-Ala-D/L-Glu epimerase